MTQQKILSSQLADSGVTPGTYTAADITIDAAGRVTAASNGGSGGTVTSIAVSGNNGVGVAGSPITSSGTITLSLGAITPTSVAAVGTVTGSNLSGTNTGDQTITLTGDVTGSGTGSFATTLSDTGVSAGAYTSANVTVDSKGRVTSISNGSSVPSIPLNEVVYGTGAGITSDPDLTFDTTTDTLTVGSTGNGEIVAATGFSLTLGSDNGTYTLTLGAQGDFIINGDPGAFGQVLTSQGSSSPPFWGNAGASAGINTEVQLSDGVGGFVAGRVYVIDSPDLGAGGVLVTLGDTLGSEGNEGFVSTVISGQLLTPDGTLYGGTLELYASNAQFVIDKPGQNISGGDVRIRAGSGGEDGTPDREGDGGNINIDAGRGEGNTRSGGYITIAAGNGGASADAGGVNIVGGDSTAGQGGNILVEAGAGVTGSGGVTINASAGTDINAGAVAINSGTATGDDIFGGGIALFGGNQTGANTTYPVDIAGGGTVDLIAGSATGQGIGGNITLLAGNSSAGHAGSINLICGSGNFTNPYGSLTVQVDPAGNGYIPLRVHANGNTTVGVAGLDGSNDGTSNTGFPYISSVTSDPTGTPTDITGGHVPMVFNRTNNKLWIYNGGWVSVTLS